MLLEIFLVLKTMLLSSFTISKGTDVVSEIISSILGFSIDPEIKIFLVSLSDLKV